MVRSVGVAPSSSRVKALHVFTLLAGFERSKQVPHLVVPEAREREVEVRRRLKVGEEPGEELLVPGATDLVERQPEQPRLFHGDVEPGDRHARKAEPPGSHEALMAPDDGPILPSRQDRLDEAELAEAALQGVELVVRNASRVGRIGVEPIDRHLLDGEGGDRHDSYLFLISS